VRVVARPDLDDSLRAKVAARLDVLGEEAGGIWPASG